MVKKSVNMRTNVRITPRGSQKMKRKTILFYAAVTVAFATIVSIIVFTFLNLGNMEKAFAAGSTYSSARSGGWTTASTWAGGSAPGVTGLNGDDITVNTNHIVTVSAISFTNNGSITIKPNATLNILGNVVVDNNFVLNNSGNLTVSGNFTVKNGGSITINGTGITQINGNFILNNNNNVLVNGNLTVGNAISFGSNYVFSGSGFVSTGSGCNYWSGSGSCSTGTLPIKLLSFDAAEDNGRVKLSWKTASEENNNFFTLERSSDGKTFESIGTVPGAGTTMQPSAYDFEDAHPKKGLSYYRLSQTDFDGKSETFKAVAVEVTQSNKAAVQIYPNPLAGNVLTVSIADPQDGTIEIVDSKGNSVLAQVVSAHESSVVLTLDESITPGVYFVNHNAGGRKETVRLVKK